MIKVPFSHVRRIIHLADVHIRLFKRHEEYREQFDRLYQTLAATDLTETVIVVAGDIVHAKTDLSPEMVELASDFLDSLARLAPTLVIAGNHDMNLANKNRLDSLTPIVQNIKNPNLHYLKHSGIYPCADVDFYCCSIVGEQAEWPSPTGLRKKIALFHGPIHNAQTDVGYTVTNRHVMIETFDGFSMVLLGDIHKHQVLQERSIDANKPVIVYPGSLIQQNHGENYKGHGWCDWDVASETFTYHELPNEYGYYTLRVENGVVPNWDDMPMNVYLRVFAGSLDQAAIKALEAKIRSKRFVKEFSVSSFDGARTTSSGVTFGSILDIADINLQNKLIVEYLRDAMPSISDETLDRVLKLNKEKNEEAAADDLARKIIWKPLSLKYDNLFTYGESNFINLKDMNGVVGIFAPNASGKTSIAEAICFALYDRTPRTIKASNIMNTRTKTCFCEFRFEIEGTEFVIQRTGTKNKKGEVKIDVNFFKLVDGKEVSLNGEERRYTNKNIVGYVGEFEDFLLTTFSSSSQQGLFVDRGQSDRKDLLSQFMGLTLFDRLHTLANDESKEVAGALKRFKQDDFTQDLADVRKEMDERYAEVEYNELGLAAVNKKLNDLSDEINCLYEAKVPVSTFTATRSELEAAVHNAERRLTVENEKAEQAAQVVADLTEKMARAKVKLEEMANVEDNYNKLKQIQSERSQLVNRIAAGERALGANLRTYETLQKHKYDPSCEFCVLNGKDMIESMVRLESERDILTASVEKDMLGVANFDLDIAELGDVEDRYKKLITGRQWVTKTELEIAQAQTVVAQLDSRLARINSDIRAAQETVEEYDRVKEKIEINAQYDAAIKVVESQKAVKKLEFTRLTHAISTAKARYAVLEQREVDMLKKIKEAEELESKYEAYEAYLAAVCRDGLPYKLISDIIPALEVAVNNLLHQMVGFTLLFETDGKNINMKIRYDDARVWPLELASGMEKFISGLAIRVALTSVSSLPKSNFLIIDEGLGTLDHDNLASIFMLFNVLRTQFDFIMLISHVDEVRDVADSLVEIKRTDDGFSQIQVN